MQEWGSSRELDAAVSGDSVRSVRPSALPGLLSAIKQAAGSSLLLDHWADPAGQAELEVGQEGRMMEEEEGKKPPASPRPKSGVAALGWFPHSWDSIPHEGRQASSTWPSACRCCKSLLACTMAHIKPSADCPQVPRPLQRRVLEERGSCLHSDCYTYRLCGTSVMHGAASTVMGRTEG